MIDGGLEADGLDRALTVAMGVLFEGGLGDGTDTAERALASVGEQIGAPSLTFEIAAPNQQPTVVSWRDDASVGSNSKPAPDAVEITVSSDTSESCVLRVGPDFASSDDEIEGWTIFARALRAFLTHRKASDRWRQMDEMRTAIAIDYVEAEHWEVTEVTQDALQAIGEATDALAVSWVMIDHDNHELFGHRWWSEASQPSDPKRDPSIIEHDADDLIEAQGPFSRVVHKPTTMYETLWPARPFGRSEGCLIVCHNRPGAVTSPEIAALNEISGLIHQMEEWAITEAGLMRQRERLAYEATHDELTGLGNRRLMIERLEKALQEGPAAVLMIDMDRFKVINDSLGHGAGDSLLVTVADRLRMSLREPDLTCRYGGDEFAVLVRSSVDDLELSAIATRLIETVREPVSVGETLIIPTCSVGITVARDGDNLETVIRHADAALYDAKGRGRDQYAFFNDDHRETLRERLSLETRIRQGARDHEFRPWFQPEIDLNTRQITGFEALLRWHHPRDGVKPAASFIDIADDIGLAGQLSRVALQDSCAALAQWRDEFDLETRVRVNVAAAQLQTTELYDDLMTAMERYNLTADQICIEITERSLMLDIDTAVGHLHMIRELGIEVAVDDFGTGFSSFARLRNLPVDTLKIDRSFVAGVADHRRDREIVRTIAWLASALELSVVAEGVETEPQADILRELGCERAQGWLWSKAVHPNKVPKLFARGFGQSSAARASS